MCAAQGILRMFLVEDKLLLTKIVAHPREMFLLKINYYCQTLLLISNPGGQILRLQNNRLSLNSVTEALLAESQV